MSGPALLELECSSATDPGLERESNQDATASYQNAFGARLFVVADGMGGHRGGDVASRLATEAIGEVFSHSEDSPELTLREAFRVANRKVVEEAAKRPELRGMGTTAVALYLGPGGVGWLANVGDSRAYRLRAGRLEQLSEDHSLVSVLERKGFMSREEATQHPRRNQVTRSIGLSDDTFADVRPVRAEPGDAYLLCSDGLHGVVPDVEIETTVACTPAKDVAARLVGMANAKGGPDNITVHFIACPGGEPATRPNIRYKSGKRNSRVRLIAASIAVVTALLLLAVVWYGINEIG